MLEVQDHILMLPILMLHEMRDPLRVRDLAPYHNCRLLHRLPFALAYGHTRAVRLAVTVRRGVGRGSGMCGGLRRRERNVDGGLPAEDSEVLQDGLAGRLGVFDDMPRFLTGKKRRKTVLHQTLYAVDRIRPCGDGRPWQCDRFSDTHVCSTKSLISPYPFLANRSNTTPSGTFSSSR